MSAFSRFPELLMEHPDPTESAFRALVLSGVVLRDPDEWGEHYMASMAPVGSGSGLNQGRGVGDAVLSGWAGEKRRLAEVDGSAVVVVEVILPAVESRGLSVPLLRCTCILGPRLVRAAHPAALRCLMHHPPTHPESSVEGLLDSRTHYLP